ncbi:MAG TPA: cell wall hydrolase [Sphingomicrobium sp.]|nr:cell wall hydrolase [Sphingomicrobium sp.]
MTALARTARRLGWKSAGLRIEAIALAVVLLIAAAAFGALLVARNSAGAATVTVPISPTKAAQLIDATNQNQMQAIGEQAKLINAALPFANGPLHAASAFAISGSDLDQRRALLCLTQAVYYEAGFEPIEGRRAVAQVVLNRMRHPAFPKSICGVVYQGAGSGVCQFTFVCDGALYRAPARDAWLQAEVIARAALAGYVETRVGEATHYHADYVAPRWAPMLAKVAQIGQHIFYRWPGAWGQPASFTGRYIGEPRDPLAMRPPPPSINPAEPLDAIAAVNGPVTDGTLLKHAPDDVGGLLDTSKGWTLSIPGPGDTDGAAAKLIASQEKKAPTQIASAGAAPEVASR